MNDRLVLLHGWGATDHDLAPLGDLLARAHTRKLEVVCLGAPEPHPSGFGRQWYGLFPPDYPAIPAAVADLRTRLEALNTPMCPLERTVLMGFSQGGAMALEAGCSLPFAAVISCSGYPHPSWQPPSQHPPVLLLHGADDEVVPVSSVDDIWDRLDPERRAKQISSCGHTINDAAIDAISQMLKRHLP